MEMKFQTGAIELWRGAEGFVNTPHIHEDWVQLTLPVQGSCEFIQDGRAWNLQPGSGLVQPPRALHHFQLERGASVIILKCREDAVEDVFARAGRLCADELAKGFDAQELARRFVVWSGSLMQAQLAGETDVLTTERDIVAYMNQVLSASREQDNPEQQPSADRAGLPLDAGPGSGMQKVVDFLQDGYAGRIAIDELASIACMSRFHFIRSFRAETGLTPYQYLLRLRIEEAKNRLSQSSESISRISEELGFSSPSQLYRSFLKLAGTTPQAYRDR